MHGDSRQVVSLSEEVPVYLLYFTAGVDGEGAIRFEPDIYGRDSSAMAERFVGLETQD